MKQIRRQILILGAGLALSPCFAADSRTLVGWGLDAKDPETFINDAAGVGFDELIAGSNDPVFLEKAVGIGKQHGIRIFSCITPQTIAGKLWKDRYPDRPVPWQAMSEDEEAAARFIGAGTNKCMMPYQWGGEPKLASEVLLSKIVCVNHTETLELFHPVIDAIVAVPGIEGIAFDGFGYQNYHGCRCDTCRRLLEEYRKAHPDQSEKEAETVFFRDAIVAYVNQLADYARSRNPEIKTAIHIWPVFAPEPLYGNRLDVDYCGQTTAWYMLWPQEKIAEYSRIVSADAAKYHPRQKGVGMIGYYNLPGTFPVKDAARVDLELKTMVENGCSRVQVCGAKDVIHNPEIAAVFRRYFLEAPPRSGEKKPFRALGAWRRTYKD